MRVVPLMTRFKPAGTVSKVRLILFGWKDWVITVRAPSESVAVSSISKKLVSAPAKSSGAGVVKVMLLPEVAGTKGCV